MSRRNRRRSGVALLMLIAVQSVATPLGACAQEPGDQHEREHEVAATHHTSSDDATMGMRDDHAAGSHHAPLPTPVDCVALAACGAPAIGANATTAGIVSVDHVVQKLRGILDEPAVFVLGLTTPPPKI